MIYESIARTDPWIGNPVFQQPTPFLQRDDTKHESNPGKGIIFTTAERAGGIAKSFSVKALPEIIHYSNGSGTAISCAAFTTLLVTAVVDELMARCLIPDLCKS